MKLYVARDDGGKLTFFNTKPRLLKHTNANGTHEREWEGSSVESCVLSRNLFPRIKRGECVEVELVIKEPVISKKCEKAISVFRKTLGGG